MAGNVSSMVYGLIIVCELILVGTEKDQEVALSTIIKVRRGINGFKYSACDENGKFIGNLRKLADAKIYWKKSIQTGHVKLIRELNRYPENRGDYESTSDCVTGIGINTVVAKIPQGSEKEWEKNENIISFIDERIDTTQKLIYLCTSNESIRQCIVQMACAYYSCGNDYKKTSMEIAGQKVNFLSKRMNGCCVLYIDMEKFLSTLHDNENPIEIMKKNMKEVILHGLDTRSKIGSLTEALIYFTTVTGNKIFIIINDWDLPYRKYHINEEYMLEYMNLLRLLFKTNLTDICITAALLTGKIHMHETSFCNVLCDFYEYSREEKEPLSDYIDMDTW